MADFVILSERKRNPETEGNKFRIKPTAQLSRFDRRRNLERNKPLERRGS